MITRRGIITGLISLVAAPAIVRVTSIMPVRTIMPFRLDVKYGIKVWSPFDLPNCRCVINYNELYEHLKIWHEELIGQYDPTKRIGS